MEGLTWGRQPVWPVGGRWIKCTSVLLRARCWPPPRAIIHQITQLKASLKLILQILATPDNPSFSATQLSLRSFQTASHLHLLEQSHFSSITVALMLPSIHIPLSFTCAFCRPLSADLYRACFSVYHWSASLNEDPPGFLQEACMQMSTVQLQLSHWPDSHQAYKTHQEQGVNRLLILSSN